MLSITAEAGLSIPDASRARLIEALKAVVEGRIERNRYGGDDRLLKLAALAALARNGAATPAMLGQIGMPVGDMPTGALADWLVILDKHAGPAPTPPRRRPRPSGSCAAASSMKARGSICRMSAMRRGG